MNQTEFSDKELIARCRRGDHAAFDELYHRYRLPLFSYIHRLLPGNPSMVDDVFQQVWCRALANWDRYSDRQRLLAWLCRIAHNLVMDHYRRHRHVFDGEVTDNDAVSESLNAQEQLMDDELWDALDQAIAGLPDDQRAVVEARRAGQSFNEIAQQQGSSVNTVLGRMHYAVKKLRSCLSDHLA